MKHDIRVTGPAAILALVALIVALALAAPHATAPERAEVSAEGGAAVPVLQTAGTSAPSEDSASTICGSPGADPGNCSYE